MTAADELREAAAKLRTLAADASTDPDGTPTGQMSWHIAERDRDLFEHVQLVPAEHNVWDGHTTEQKYARLRRLTANPNRAEAAIARVIGLHERWLAAGAPPLGTPIARWWDARLIELHDAIRPPADEPTKD